MSGRLCSAWVCETFAIMGVHCNKYECFKLYRCVCVGMMHLPLVQLTSIAFKSLRTGRTDIGRLWLSAGAGDDESMLARWLEDWWAEAGERYTQLNINKPANTEGIYNFRYIWCSSTVKSAFDLNENNQITIQICKNGCCAVLTVANWTGLGEREEGRLSESARLEMFLTVTGCAHERV